MCSIGGARSGGLAGAMTWFFIVTIVLTPGADLKGAMDVIRIGGFESQAQCETVRGRTQVTTERLTSKLPCREEPKP